MPNLIELPNGDWIDTAVVRGITVLTDRSHGPRVRIDTANAVGCVLFEFDDPEAARIWVRDFARRVNAASAEAQPSD